MTPRGGQTLFCADGQFFAVDETDSGETERRGEICDVLRIEVE